MDRDGALREVAKVYESIKLQQPLLLLHSSSQSPPSPSTTTTTWLAHDLLGQALRGLNVALSVMKQQQPAAALSGSGGGPPAVTPPPPPAELVKAEPGPGPGGLLPSISSQETGSRSGKRPRSSSAIMAGRNKKQLSASSWVNFTTVPYEDGYEWRKYGEKKINGAGHTRSYFRCTHRDGTGCRATKHVQQRDGGGGSDPPVFHVTYNGKHTCRSGGGSGGVCCTATPTTSSAAGAIFVADSSMVAAAMVNMQQESPAAPATMSTTSSVISGELSFSDEYSAAGGVDDMAAPMAGVEEEPAPADDDVPFSDLELFLLCNSFKDY